MTRLAPARRFAPQMLELEDRVVPAGNVTATLVGHQLRVFGDAADNNIVLRGDGNGVVEIQGVNTKINGTNAKPSFSGVNLLWVDVGDGNDTVRSRTLAIRDIYVFGGSGDDVINLANTTGSTDGLGLIVAGDNGGLNGNDTITITGTTVQGYFAYFDIWGDDYYDTVTGLDRITLSNTKIDVANYVDLGISRYGEYLLSGPGNIITVDSLDVSVNSTVGSYHSITFQGGTGDDQFQLHDVNILLHDVGDVVADFFVGSYEGDDTIEASNISLAAITDLTVGHSFEVFNQFWASFYANTIRVNNLYFEGGGYFYFTNFGGYSYTTGSVGFVGSDIDVRNVTSYSKGSGSIGLGNTEWFTGIEHDEHWTISNVHASSADGRNGGLYLDSGGGNDHITVTNSSCEQFYASLGEGDDTLSLQHVTATAHYPSPYFGQVISGGGGNDAVTMQNCTFEQLSITLDDGDDTLALKNNIFDTLVADLGDGDDSAMVHNNTATDSISVDGGDGIDTLLAWGNIAPMLVFDDFDL